MSHIDIVLVDKSPLVLAGLTKIFGDDPRFSIIATAADGERFMEAHERHSMLPSLVGKCPI